MQIIESIVDGGELCLKVQFEDFLCGEEVLRYKSISLSLSDLPTRSSFHISGVVYDLLIERQQSGEGYVLVVSGGDLEKQIVVNI